MTRVLRHRGPDHHATWQEGPAALGHRRLSILDLSPRGHQPMASHCGRFVIVFNGEIYNFRALRAELEKRGERFDSDGDTEVVLSAFRLDGPVSFARLNGMFAIAVWDRSERTLTLARDRFGQKPLYYASSGAGLVFGSEIKALLASRRATRNVNWEAIEEFCFFGNALGTRTLFADIEKLLPGQWLRLSQAGIESAPFWRIEDVPRVEDPRPAAIARVTTILDASVERHLVSDVPVGAFLSGGIDSSAITMFAARRLGKQLRTYSVAFDDDVGELPGARMVAALAGSEHHELRIHGRDIPGTVRALISHHDQPFGDAANIPLYMLAKHLEGQAKVVLQGDGGDELFAGYRRYNVLAFQQLWQAVGRGQPLLAKLPQSRSRDRLARFLAAVSDPDAGRMMALLLTEERETPAPTRLLSAAVRARLANRPFARYSELAKRLEHLPPVQKMLHTDCSIILPDIFNEKVDRATMAHGLEVRLPFLDNELTQYVLGLPWQYKVHRLQKKWLLRKALRGIVPDSILDAPKRGFGVPYGAWLRGPLRASLEDALLGGGAQRDGLLDRESCIAVMREHLSGTHNHGFLLYKMLQFALWYDSYIAEVPFQAVA